MSLYEHLRFGSFSPLCPTFGAVLDDVALASVVGWLRTDAQVEFRRELQASSVELDDASMLLRGAEVYQQSCLACHGDEGKGMPGVFPPLAESDFLTDREATLRAIVHGVGGPMVVNGVAYDGVMPAMWLSDVDVAAVTTWIGTQWRNQFPPVVAAEVAAVR